MDILAQAKIFADHIVWDVIDLSLLISIVRLASLLINTTLFLSLGRRLLSPAGSFKQWTLALLGTAVTLATPLHGLFSVPRGLLVWIILFCFFVIVSLPGAIAKAMTPDRRRRAQIKRVLYCLILGTLLAQEISIWTR